jgi:hypothetical protein
LYCIHLTVLLSENTSQEPLLYIIIPVANNLLADGYDLTINDKAILYDRIGGKCNVMLELISNNTDSNIDAILSAYLNIYPEPSNNEYLKYSTFNIKIKNRKNISLKDMRRFDET